MYIEAITLKNFGPFKHVEETFEQGLIGVFGPNGSGKSTIVNGIYAALTNDFSRFSGTKLDQICGLADDSESSFVEIRVKHADRSFRIRRSLRPSSSKLWLDGESSPVTNSNTIRQILATDFAVDRNMVDSYVFVQQGQMTQFLSQTPAARAEAFQRLCGTETARLIQEGCASFTSSLGSDEQAVDNSDDLADQLQQGRDEVERLQSEIEDLASETPDEADLSALQEVCDTRRLFVRRNRQRKEQKSELQAAEQLTEESSTGRGVDSPLRRKRDGRTQDPGRGLSSF